MQVRGLTIILFSAVLSGVLVAPQHVIIGGQKTSVGTRAWFQPDPTVIQMISEPAERPENYEVGVYVDDSHAWLTEPHSFLRTSDGGQTWLRLKPTASNPPSTGLGDISLGKLEFQDARRGWFSSNTGIWKTTDAGDAWMLVSGGSYSDIHFFNTKRGWIDFFIDSGNRRYAQSQHTADGGDTWTGCGRVSEQDMSDVNAAMDTFDYHVNRAFFLSEDMGWAISTKAFERNKTDGVFFTNDGGCNWNLLWENPGGSIDPDESFSAIYFIDKKHGWMGGGYLGGVFGTNDGGLTWQTLASSAYIPSVEEIYFQTLNEGWLISTVNQQNPMLHTVDGGRKWRPMSSKEIAIAQLPAKWSAGRFIQVLARHKVR
jgi:photosystem II stability/assembly factor-like uncharacterized protein